MFRSANHCRNSPFPYVVSAATESGARPLPCGEVREHVLCGHGLLTHARCRRLHTNDHTAVVVDQVVVVISQPRWRPALGGVSRIGIGGRDLVLLMNRLFHWVL